MLRTTYTRSVGAGLGGGSGGGVGVRARLSSTIRHSSNTTTPARPAAASSSSTVTAVATLTALSGLSYFAGTRTAPPRDATAAATARALHTRAGPPPPAPELTAPPTDRLQVAPGPSEAEVTRLLSAEAYSHAGAAGSGVRRYDGTRVASNAPCEDRFVHGSFAAPRGGGGGSAPWSVWGVFDGHAGWQTAEHLTHQLVPFVRHALERAAGDDEAAVQAAVRRAFVALDDAIVQGGAALALGDDAAVSYADKARRLALAYAGSCALLALLDPCRRVLHVACTGDSRAVLGTPKEGTGADDDPDAAGAWEATALSEDQTGHSPSEAARLAAAHPGEPGVVKGGRVLGIAVSRALGDGRWKWDLATQHALKRAHNGSVLPADRYNVRTPPYLTAEPVVTSTPLPPPPPPSSSSSSSSRRPAFLILASDGFWDRIDNAQAVDLVGRWLAWQQDKEKNKMNQSKNKQPPVAASESEQQQQPPFDRERYRSGHAGPLSTRFWAGRAACRDDNVAVHLVRNALGGEFHGMVAGLLATGSPFSRDIRDDITVQVVFFE